MSPGSPGSHTQTGGPVIALRSKSFQSTHSRSSSRRPDRGPGRADRDRDRTAAFSRGGCGDAFGVGATWLSLFLRLVRCFFCLCVGGCCICLRVKLIMT